MRGLPTYSSCGSVTYVVACSSLSMSVHMLCIWYSDVLSVLSSLLLVPTGCVVMHTVLYNRSQHC